MRPEIALRPYESDDLPGVLALIRRCLGETALQPRSREWFEWKHFENPFGRSILIVAEAKGKIVGLRAFLQWRLVTSEGATVRCARPVDTATDPNYRRLGIFRRSTLEAIEEAERLGLDMLFNTPNPRSGAGYTSMGWAEVGSVGVMIRPKLGLLTHRSSPPVDWVRVTDEVGTPAIRFPSRPPLGLRTPRTEKYLRWRFGSNPNTKYHQVGKGSGGVIARENMRGGRREVVISDLYGDAVAAIRRLASKAEVEYLVGWFSRRSPERRTAIRGGLLPVPRARALTLMVRPLQELPFDPCDPKAWDLALSDLELL